MAAYEVWLGTDSTNFWQEKSESDPFFSAAYFQNRASCFIPIRTLVISNPNQNIVWHVAIATAPQEWLAFLSNNNYTFYFVFKPSISLLEVEYPVVCFWYHDIKKTYQKYFEYSVLTVHGCSPKFKS